MNFNTRYADDGLSNMLPISARSIICIADHACTRDKSIYIVYTRKSASNQLQERALRIGKAKALVLERDSCCGEIPIDPAQMAVRRNDAADVSIQTNTLLNTVLNACVLASDEDLEGWVVGEKQNSRSASPHFPTRYRKPPSGWLICCDREQLV